MTSDMSERIELFEGKGALQVKLDSDQGRTRVAKNNPLVNGEIMRCHPVREGQVELLGEFLEALGDAASPRRVEREVAPPGVILLR
jgi:hypothetical protein